MPRQREADAEDMMARCPRCRGSERVYDFTTETEVECPLCEGTGRVTQVTYQQYVKNLP